MTDYVPETIAVALTGTVERVGANSADDGAVLLATAGESYTAFSLDRLACTAPLARLYEISPWWLHFILLRSWTSFQLSW